MTLEHVPDVGDAAPQRAPHDGRPAAGGGLLHDPGDDADPRASRLLGRLLRALLVLQPGLAGARLPARRLRSARGLARLRRPVSADRRPARQRRTAPRSPASSRPPRCAQGRGVRRRGVAADRERWRDALDAAAPAGPAGRAVGRRLEGGGVPHHARHRRRRSSTWSTSTRSAPARSSPAAASRSWRRRSWPSTGRTSWSMMSPVYLPEITGPARALGVRPAQLVTVEAATSIRRRLTGAPCRRAARGGRGAPSASACMPMRALPAGARRQSTLAIGGQSEFYAHPEGWLATGRKALRDDRGQAAAAGGDARMRRRASLRRQARHGRRRAAGLAHDPQRSAPRPGRGAPAPPGLHGRAGLRAARDPDAGPLDPGAERGADRGQGGSAHLVDQSRRSDPRSADRAGDRWATSTSSRRWRGSARRAPSSASPPARSRRASTPQGQLQTSRVSNNVSGVAPPQSRTDTFYSFGLDFELGDRPLGPDPAQHRIGRRQHRRLDRGLPRRAGGALRRGRPQLCPDPHPAGADRLGARATSDPGGRFAAHRQPQSRRARARPRRPAGQAEPRDDPGVRAEACAPRWRRRSTAGGAARRVPEHRAGRAGAAAPIPSPPAEVVVGLPTELLRQRPDIRRPSASLPPRPRRSASPRRRSIRRSRFRARSRSNPSRAATC